LIASIEGFDSAAMVIAEAEPVAANTRVTTEHDEQVAPIATRLADRVAVHLADTSGRPLADVPVVWATMDGGSVTPAAARTDSLGDITASWVLGPTARRQRLRVAVGNGRLVRPTILHALALPGPAASVSAVSGSGQQGVPGKELAKPVILRVTDVAGNAVPNVRIMLRPSGGVLADSAPATDSLGAVRARWTLPVGTPSTPLHLSARVDGIVQPVVVVASMGAPPPPNSRHHHHAT
jgi:hypothetical protein